MATWDDLPQEIVHKILTISLAEAISKYRMRMKAVKEEIKPRMKRDVCVWQRFIFGNRIVLGAKAYKAYCESNGIDTKLPVWFNTPHGKVIKCLDYVNYDSQVFWVRLPHSEMDEGKYV